MQIHLIPDILLGLPKKLESLCPHAYILAMSLFLATVVNWVIINKDGYENNSQVPWSARTMISPIMTSNLSLAGQHKPCSKDNNKFISCLLPPLFDLK